MAGSACSLHHALVLVLGTNIAVLLDCSKTKSSRQCSLSCLLTSQKKKKKKRKKQNTSQKWKITAHCKGSQATAVCGRLAAGAASPTWSPISRWMLVRPSPARKPRAPSSSGVCSASASALKTCAEGAAGAAGAACGGRGGRGGRTRCGLRWGRRGGRGVVRGGCGVGRRGHRGATSGLGRVRAHVRALAPRRAQRCSEQRLGVRK